MDEEKLIILVQGHECLYNLQHRDYDNNLVKDNCWKEIAGEVHAQGKEQATQYFVLYRKDNLLNCWTSSSDISGYHTDFHKGHSTVGAGHGCSMACVN
jgi:broad-specificity NMP kinase